MDEDYPDEATKATLWVFGAIHQMKLMGLIGGESPITPKGLSKWDQLDMEFKPSDAQIKSLAKYLIEPEVRESMLILLFDFRDNREGMQKFVDERGCSLD